MRHFRIFAAILAALPLTPALADPGQDAIKQYQTSMAAQRQTPGPAIQITPAITAVAQDAVLARLRDPDSAKWGEIRVFQAKTAGQLDVCGAVNAKNAMGGYTGMEPFHVVLSGGAAAPMAVDASISRPGRRGYFFEDAPMCNPASW